MEVTALASTITAINVPAPSNTQLTQSLLTSKPNVLTLCSLISFSRNKFSSLTRCSTKSNTNTDNETDPNSTLFEPDPDTITQNPSNPISSEAILTSTPSSRGMVLDLGPVDAWDSKEIGSPVVKRFLGDEEERWYMWYHGRSNQTPDSDSIGLAISSNGVHWERGKLPVNSSGDVGLVMICGNDWWAFDTECIRPSEAVIMSNSKVRASTAVYWLYYTGYSSETVDFAGHDSVKFKLENPECLVVDGMTKQDGGNGRIFKSLPGLAISQDGRHWARIEGEHHSGALFDVGCETDWDSLFIANPQVVFHGNGDLRMYYHSFDVENGHFGIGISRSRDGIKWLKLGKIIGASRSCCFDESGATNAYVVRDTKDGKYLMAYEGVAADGCRSIGLAVSPDGLNNWRRVQDEAVLKPSVGDGWDNRDVGSPCLVHMDGDVDEWRLYYRGVGGEGRTGIGMAVSNGSDLCSLKRWTGFHL